LTFHENVIRLKVCHSRILKNAGHHLIDSSQNKLYGLCKDIEQAADLETLLGGV